MSNDNASASGSRASAAYSKRDILSDKEKKRSLTVASVSSTPIKSIATSQANGTGGDRISANFDDRSIAGTGITPAGARSVAALTVGSGKTTTNTRVKSKATATTSPVNGGVGAGNDNDDVEESYGDKGEANQNLKDLLDASNNHIPGFHIRVGLQYFFQRDNLFFIVPLAVVTTAVVIIYFLVAFGILGNVYRGNFWDDDPSYNVQWEGIANQSTCEYINIQNFIRQPGNMVSSCLYIILGMYCIAFMVNDINRHLHRKYRTNDDELEVLIIRQPVWSFVIGASLILVGLASSLYHASHTVLAARLDTFSWWVLDTTFISYVWARLFLDGFTPTDKRTEKYCLGCRCEMALPAVVTKAISIFVVIFCIAAKIAIDIGLYVYLVTLEVLSVHSIVFVIMLALFLAPIALHWRLRSKDVDSMWHMLLLSAFFGGLAYALNWYDSNRFFCAPRSFIQGHAFWQLFSALGVFCVYLFFRGDVGIFKEDIENALKEEKKRIKALTFGMSAKDFHRHSHSQSLDGRVPSSSQLVPQQPPSPMANQKLVRSPSMASQQDSMGVTLNLDADVQRQRAGSASVAGMAPLNLAASPAPGLGQRTNSMHSVSSNPYQQRNSVSYNPRTSNMISYNPANGTGVLPVSPQMARQSLTNQTSQRIREETPTVVPEPMVNVNGRNSVTVQRPMRERYPSGIAVSNANTASGDFSIIQQSTRIGSGSSQTGVRHSSGSSQPGVRHNSVSSMSGAQRPSIHTEDEQLATLHALQQKRSVRSQNVNQIEHRGSRGISIEHEREIAGVGLDSRRVSGMNSSSVNVVNAVDTFDTPKRMSTSQVAPSTVSGTVPKHMSAIGDLAIGGAGHTPQRLSTAERLQQLREEKARILAEEERIRSESLAEGVNLSEEVEEIQQDKPLPQGWTKAKDPGGETFYFHPGKGISQYEFPTE